jgi:hypothetical protein
VKRLALLAAIALIGCDRYPPVAAYVTDPPPPAKPVDDLGASDELPLTVGTATGVVFLVNDQSTFSGTRPGDEARSLNDGVVRVLPTTDDASVSYGSPRYTGKVFVLYGVAPGDTSIEIFEEGQSMGIISIHVLPQE